VPHTTAPAAPQKCGSRRCLLSGFSSPKPSPLSLCFAGYEDRTRASRTRTQLPRTAPFSLHQIIVRSADPVATTELGNCVGCHVVGLKAGETTAQVCDLDFKLFVFQGLCGHAARMPRADRSSSSSFLFRHWTCQVHLTFGEALK